MSIHSVFFPSPGCAGCNCRDHLQKQKKKKPLIFYRASFDQVAQISLTGLSARQAPLISSFFPQHMPQSLLISLSW